MATRAASLLCQRVIQPLRSLLARRWLDKRVLEARLARMTLLVCGLVHHSGSADTGPTLAFCPLRALWSPVCVGGTLLFQFTDLRCQGPCVRTSFCLRVPSRNRASE